MAGVPPPWDTLRLAAVVFVRHRLADARFYEIAAAYGLRESVCRFAFGQVSRELLGTLDEGALLEQARDDGLRGLTLDGREVDAVVTVPRRKTRRRTAEVPPAG